MTFCRSALSCLTMLVVSAALLAACVGDARAARYYTAVSLADEQHGWFAGADGQNFVVWKTTDGGVTLKRQSAHMTAGSGWGCLAFYSASVGLWSDDTGVRQEW